MSLRAAEEKAGGRERKEMGGADCSWPRERKHLIPKTLKGKAKRVWKLTGEEAMVTQQKIPFSEICVMAALTMMSEQERSEFAKGR